jgi:hypothetical protein
MSVFSPQSSHASKTNDSGIVPLCRAQTRNSKARAPNFLWMVAAKRQTACSLLWSSCNRWIKRIRRLRPFRRVIWTPLLLYCQLDFPYSTRLLLRVRYHKQRKQIWLSHQVQCACMARFARVLLAMKIFPAGLYSGGYLEAVARYASRKLLGLTLPSKLTVRHVPPECMLRLTFFKRTNAQNLA